MKKYLIAIFSVLWCGCGTAPVQESKAQHKAAQGPPVKIVNFYARDAILTEGEKTVLCYGVENATSVHVEPPVDGVSPALTRCVEVKPKRTTEYKMIAEGGGWRVVSDPVTVTIAADTAALPKITSFTITGCKKDYEGSAVFSLSFNVQNPEEVYTDPPSMPTLHGAPYGQFGVKVKETTTYTLIVKGKFGHVDKKPLTLDVTKCK
jgi:hypothetical protein